MTAPWEPSYLFTQVLDRLKYAVEQRVSRQAAESLRVEQIRDIVTGDLVVQVTGWLLADTLPAKTLTDRMRFTVPRFATWFDAFCATYRGRWWGRLLHLREPRFVDEPLTHSLTVTLRERWTYPQATRVLPAVDWGHTVLNVETSQLGRAEFW